MRASLLPRRRSGGLASWLAAALVLACLALGALGCDDGATSEPGDDVFDTGGDPDGSGDGDLIIDTNTDMPSDLGPCGGVGAACCEGDLCGDDLACHDNGLCGGCGARGEPCCGGGDCDDGACVDGQCSACGGPGQPCCAGSSCPQPDQACRQGTCQDCGGLDQPCCANGTCDDASTVCGDDDTCRSCGGPGEPCCADGSCQGEGCCAIDTCAGAGQMCAYNDGVCAGNSCGGCGGLGETCCPPFEFCSAPGTACDSATVTCVASCGGIGQPCCNEGYCVDGCCGPGLCMAIGSLCTAPDEGVCVSPNTCAPCGVHDTSPCPEPEGCLGGACLDAATGLCMAPGAAASTDGQVCVSGALVDCGAPGEPCCESRSCDGDGCCGVGRLCVAPADGCGALGSGTCGDQVAGGCGSCGGEDQPCCGNDLRLCTAPDMACVEVDLDDFRCRPCGGPGQPCCAGNLCDGPGCCTGDDICIAAGTTCGGGGLCDAGRCRGPSGSCGGHGDSECSAHCTADYTVAALGTCEACGGDRQPCCDNHDTPWCGPGLGCSDGDCQPCGLKGRPCCDGFECVSGVCDNGYCP